MSKVNAIPFMILTTILLSAPSKGFPMDVKKEIIPIVQKLQDGKAKISPDKKSIIDEEGHIIGKLTSTLDMKKYTPSPPNPAEAAKEDSPPVPQLFNCIRKCGLITKQCYLDDNENAVCIGICDKESLICE